MIVTIYQLAQRQKKVRASRDIREEIEDYSDSEHRQEDSFSYSFNEKLPWRLDDLPHINSN